MLVKALDTGRKADLSVIDSNGCNYIRDLLNNIESPIYTDDDDNNVIKTDDELKWFEAFATNEQITSDACEIMRRNGFDDQWAEAASEMGKIDIDGSHHLAITSAIDFLEDGEALGNISIGEFYWHKDKDELQTCVEDAHSELKDLQSKLVSFPSL